MRHLLLLSLTAGLPMHAAVAQVAPASKDTVAARVQVLGANCALFPEAASLPSWVKSVPREQRFTPTPRQVAAIEKTLLTTQLASINPGVKTRTELAYTKQIKAALPAYYRQYYGFYNTRHQPCFYINFLLDVDYDYPNELSVVGHSPRWLRAPIYACDAGAGFWSVYYNLTTRQFYSFWHDTSLGGNY